MLCKDFQFYLTCIRYIKINNLFLCNLYCFICNYKTSYWFFFKL